MYGAIPDLQKVDVAGDGAFATPGLRSKPNPPPGFDSGDVGLTKPDRDLNGERHGIVCQHKALERFVAQLIVPNRRNDERSGFGGCILPDIDNGMGGVRNASDPWRCDRHIEERAA